MATHASSSDYHPGEMDIHEQVYTWTMFKKFSKWGSLVGAVALLFLVLWFCTHTGFIGSALTAAVMLAVGIVVLRERKGAAH